MLGVLKPAFDRLSIAWSSEAAVPSSFDSLSREDARRLWSIVAHGARQQITPNRQSASEKKKQLNMKGFSL